MKLKEFKAQIKKCADYNEAILKFQEFIKLLSKDAEIDHESNRPIIHAEKFERIVKAAIFIKKKWGNLQRIVISDFVVNYFNFNREYHGNIIFRNIKFSIGAFTGDFKSLSVSFIQCIFDNYRFMDNRYIQYCIFQDTIFNECRINDDIHFPIYSTNNCTFKNIKRVGYYFPMSCASLSCTYDEDYINELALQLFHQCNKQHIHPEVQEALLPLAQKFRPDDETIDSEVSRWYKQDINGKLIPCINYPVSIDIEKAANLSTPLLQDLFSNMISAKLADDRFKDLVKREKEKHKVEEKDINIEKQSMDSTMNEDNDTDTTPLVTEDFNDENKPKDHVDVWRECL